MNEIVKNAFLDEKKRDAFDCGFILGLNGFETFAFDTITKVNSSEES